MANLRSFTGFLALDVLGTQNAAAGLSFAFPGANPLDIIIQDGDALLQGDSGADDQSADPQGDQIGFVTNSDGEALLDGQEIYVETSFTFTLDGAGSFTGYILENEGSSQSFVVLPPNLAAGTIAITAIDDTATDIDYALLGSGDEEISQNDFSDLDLSGADTINAGGGDDTIDAGEGDDSVSAGGGDDTVFGNAGGDTVDGGAGDDSIRGDSGEDGITAVRESFNWAELGLNNGETVPNNPNGIDQDTGNITVNLDYTELGRFADFEYRNTFPQFTDGIDTGGEAIGNDIGFLVGDGSSPPGDTLELDLNFSANTAGFEDEVRNVQFRINDLDDLNWRDIIEVRAFDANGDAVHVVLTGGGNITLTDTDGVNGFDTALANDTNTNNDPIDASNSLLVEVPGPVARINIVYGNQETAGQRVDVTDIFFDAVPTAIANVETGDDSLLGGAGDDTIFGEAGDDTIDGGADDDSVEGGAGDDLLQLTDNFGNDTITGGEIGETTGDTLDGGALTEAVNVVYSGDEAGDAANAVTGDSAGFSEIEHINTGSGDDTIDGTLDTVGIDLNAGAGADTILGGQAGDTLNAGSGADTIDGQAGDDTINAGDDADEIRLTDGFDNDSIIGGEGGNDSDTVSGATLTENVVVTYDGDESGDFTGQTSGDNAAFDEIEGVTTGSGDDTVDASADSTGQIITTNAGTDTILGGAGGDTIDAGDDDDTVDGGAGADSIAGGAGDDGISGGAGADTIDGGAGADTINGGADADSIAGGDDQDLINLTGNFGDDTIAGGEGGTDADTLDGGTLTEAINVTYDGDESGNFTGQTTGSDAQFSEIEAINTGSGDDTVDASADSVGATINTGAGDDTVLGGQGGDTLSTGSGQDTVNGGAGADSINAGDDEDSIQLTDGFGDDTIAGGEGGADDDTLAGGALTEAVTVTFNADDESGAVTNPGGDTAAFSEIEAVETGSGDDTIDGSASTGGVNVDSGAGDDTMSGGAGDDTLAAGDGADTVDGGLGADSVTGGDGDDELRISDQFGNDTIVGGEGGETPGGVGVGGDTLAGGGLTEDVTVTFNADGESGTVTNPGGDTATFSEIEAVETGSGDDTIDATGSPVGVNANSGAGDDTITGGTGGDTLAGGAGIDTIDGGAGADSIDGGADADSLSGGAGDDTITGGDGNDTIDGGEDDDFLTGGDQDDLFIYMAGQGDDTISDFNFGNTGALGDGDPTNNDFLDLTSFYTDLTEARADIADDGILNQSVGDFSDNTLLDGSLTLTGVTPGGLTTDNTGLANQVGDFPHIVQGADGGAGLNQDGDNIFDDGRFYVEFIDNTGPTTQLSDLGFDTLDGSLGTAVPYNAGTTDNLDIAAQTGTFGNDGEEYGARVTTTLDVAAGGTYTFTTTSDDGSILFINGTQVVNNDGLHASQTASGAIDLDPGQYEITVLFFENGGADNLSATISGPDTGNVALSLNDPAVNIQANAGAETVSGGAGDDTFQAGVGDDMLFGDEDQDLFVMTDGFDSDTITGGEGGADSDSIDGSALSNGVSVVYSGDEAGTFSDPFDTAIFSEIENLTLTAQDDTLDATNDTVGVNVLAGAGDDSLLGGTGGDTIAGEAGQDTLAGEAGADSLTGGDDEDTFILNDQFGDDTIVGGEGGSDSDTLEGSALTEDVSVIFDGDEQGNVTNPGGDNADFSEIEAIRTGSGQDTIDATADSAGTDIDSGAGDDAIAGGSGDDTLIAGAGDDTINGGAGTDSIDGGADDDIIDGGDNTDTIFGGAGDDSITDTGGPLSDDTIFGGAGDDTIDGGIREDAIDGGDGDDLINLTGVFGDDTIVGGEAGETNGDTVSGSTLTEDVVVTFDGDEQGDFVSQDGNGAANFEEIEAVETGLGDDTVDATLDTTGVTIITNEGEDVIIGGAGDDSIDAGDDDDTITFGQNDTVLGGAGADEFIIQPTTNGMGVIGDFDPSTNVDNTIIYDPANPPDQTDNDFVDLSGFFDNINELRAANTPNGDGDVVLDLGDGQTLTFVGVSDVTLLNFENTNVICFTRGARIRTTQGDVAVEDLVAGDLVETMDSGPQPIRWIGRRILSAGLLDATPRLRPVRIAKGALGASRDLMVSPQHRMLLSGERAEMMFGTDQVLAAAKDLVDGDMIHMGPVEDVEYFHILFDDHEIIFAEDVPTESFHPGEQALNTTTAKMQAEIFELFPELAEECIIRPTARMVLKSHEAKAFAR